MARTNAFAGQVDRGELASLLKLMRDKVDPALLEFLVKQGAGALNSVGNSDQLTQGDPNWQYRIIADSVPDKASILDLGCGEGNLLEYMLREKRARVQGVELDADQVATCVDRGIPVIQTDLDLGLKVFPDKSFDYVILEETLQTLRHPDKIIAEMRRVGRRGIVTFPNFGYWRVRLDLAVRGRMPVTGWLPYRWYQTPNIHLFSILDFIDYAEQEKMTIISIHVLENGVSRPFQNGDNLHAEEAMVLFE